MSSSNKYYLIWSLSSPDANVKVIETILTLADRNLTPRLREWQQKWGFEYPNNSGTQSLSDVNQCQNPNSVYFGSTFLELYEPVFNSLTSELIEELLVVGIPLPSEGLPPNPIRQRPSDWYIPEE